ncbi:hypothetical protein H5410_051458 [Solanum commersonii]|uniref:Uncharacterized protein n=1 Tax=Solanum commersonii TaxID=4109 RepID=A0A9J5WZK9_SOLCO|nr:hypothetical protein H5410_051458 [Solanum commersonii]
MLKRKYATVAHEMLTIVKCVLKFEDDLYNRNFKPDASKLMFARWQTQLAPFDFEILYKKGSDNSLPDFLSREYIQNELITILKILPFNQDIKELICWKIIDGMLIDLFQSIEETNNYYDAYWV